MAMFVGDADLHGRLRHADRCQALGVFGVSAVAQMKARQSSAHHRAFALAVDLHKARAHDAKGALDVCGIDVGDVLYRWQGTGAR